LDEGHNNAYLGVTNKAFYSDLTAEVGRIIAEDYFKKPYFHKLSEKVIDVLKKDKNAADLDRGKIISYLTYRAKDGYDFSRLATTNKEEDILKFAHTYISWLFEAQE